MAACRWCLRLTINMRTVEMTNTTVGVISMATIRVISKIQRVLFDAVLSEKYWITARAAEDTHVHKITAKARLLVIKEKHLNG